MKHVSPHLAPDSLIEYTCVTDAICAFSPIKCDYEWYVPLAVVEILGFIPCLLVARKTATGAYTLYWNECIKWNVVEL